MKNCFFLLGLIIIGLSSCKKTTDNTAASQAATDDAAIQAYIKTNNITAIKDPSGMYYQILAPGNSSHPTATSTVAVSYTGKLLNGTTFETAASASVALSGAIKAWQIGVPLIGNGGSILLLAPSALAYGTTTGSVYANSVLIFNIGLQGFN